MTKIDKKLTKIEENVVKLIKKTYKIHAVALTNCIFFNILDK